MAGAGPQRLTVSPGGILDGSLAVPGDKSISHRAVILAGLAEGESRVRGFLEAGDTRATAAAMCALGAVIRRDDGDELLVRGAGPEGLREPAATLDLHNSGTGLRLLTGVLAGQRFDSELTGDASLRRRPMDRVVEPLWAMGAQVTMDDGHAPLRIRGTALTGIRYRLPVASAQVKSALLLAGLFARGETCVEDPFGTRDHTERMLEYLGVPLVREGDALAVPGGAGLRARDIAVPGDLSSAAFFLTGAAMQPGARVTVRGVGVNPGRDGVLETLGEMGAEIEMESRRWAGGEPVADVTVRGGALEGLRVGADRVPRMVDEYPMLFVAAATARGVSVFEGVAELRVKESDRIAVMARALGELGVTVEAEGDRVTIHGRRLSGGRVHSGGDHRCAMALAMAGLVADGPVVVEECANIHTSFPDFPARAADLGLDIRETQ